MGSGSDERSGTIYCPACSAEQVPQRLCVKCGAVMRSRGGLFWGLVIGGITLLSMAGLALLIMAAIFGSEASELADRFVQQHPDVRRLVGGEPEVAWLREASISTENDSGEARFVVTARGPIGEASVEVELVKGGGNWAVSNASVVGANGTSTPLDVAKK